MKRDMSGWNNPKRELQIIEKPDMHYPPTKPLDLPLFHSKHSKKIKHKCKFYPTSDFEFGHGEDGSLLIHPKLHRGIRKWLWLCECGAWKWVKEK